MVPAQQSNSSGIAIKISHVASIHPKRLLVKLLDGGDKADNGGHPMVFHILHHHEKFINILRKVVD